MKKSRKGMTLIEMMFAVLISGMMGGAAILFLIEGTRASLRAMSAADNDLVQWNMSNRLQIDSKVANSAVIYPDMVASEIEPDKRRAVGERGKLLILALSTNPNGSTASVYKKLTGYYYEADDKTLKMFTYVTSDSERASGASLETIINSNLATFPLKTVATHVDAVDFDGLPFINRDVSSRNLNSAAATFQLSRGSSTLLTNNKVLVEIAFLVRG